MSLPVVSLSEMTEHFQRSNEHFSRPDAFAGDFVLRQQESQMPKLKTKSGAKKRFKVTATGKVMAAHAGKRHGMIKRTKKQIRQLRGSRVLFKTDGDNIKKYSLPNACSRPAIKVTLNLAEPGPCGGPPGVSAFPPLVRTKRTFSQR